ncbi:hypothetical protein DRP77_08235 [Candidatus Poribacteria bacterium]|nr:MAG: hypothetical protein DRP77_08235 [Candidatus Poribacteria bacterium]
MGMRGASKGIRELIPVILAATLAISSCGSQAFKGGKPLDEFEILHAVERAIVKIVERALPAVVAITARDVRSSMASYPDLGSREERIIPVVSGAGFIFRPDGYILTSEHVIRDAREIEVTLYDGREFKPKVVGVDRSTDLAVLKIEAPEPLPTLKLGDSDQVKVGQFAIAIGNPLGLKFSVTFGIISAKGRSMLAYTPFDPTVKYEDYIQTDAWLNRGNSGGPLLNSRGEVIGINSMVRTPSPFLAEGPGFAISSNLAKLVCRELIEHGRVIRAWLGIRMMKAEGGVKVMEVLEGSPAEKGGLLPGDLIVEFDGKPVEEEIEKFRLRIASTPVGKKVKIKVIRNGKPVELSVKLGEMPPRYAGAIERPSSPLEMVGIECEDLSPKLKRRFKIETSIKGVVVTRVFPRKPAARAGVKTGMIIAGVEGKRISDKDQLVETLKGLLDERRESIKLWVIDGGKRRMLIVELK